MGTGMELYPLGDAAVVVKLGDGIDVETHRRVQGLMMHVEAQHAPWVVEVVPAFATVTVFYDPVLAAEELLADRKLRLALESGRDGSKDTCRDVGRDVGQDVGWDGGVVFEGSGLGAVYECVASWLKRVVETVPESGAVAANVVEIPVCYGGEMGPDLDIVAEAAGLTAEEVVEIHTGREYLVYMIGFAPGFPYLGGMSERIGAPRKSVPRLTIPAGSVGIAGMQTGVYPLETPGGWQLIGRTPLRLFLPDGDTPSLLQAGDVVRFRAISRAEFDAWEGDGR